MRYGIFSDVHGNVEALTACIEALRDAGCERFACLGDIVGYGADPDICVDIVRDVADIVVIGNHDAAVVGRHDASHAHIAAQQGFAYSKKALKDNNIDWLQSLSYVHTDGDICFCHGSPIDAENFDYVFSLDKAASLNERFDTLSKLTFVGHSHLTTSFLVTPRLALQVSSPRFQIREGSKYVFNVGSVGQPRDRDRRACCVVYDSDASSVTFLRVEYDIDSAAQKIVDAELPPSFAERLFHGV